MMKLQFPWPSIIYLLCQLNDFSSTPVFLAPDLAEAREKKKKILLVWVAANCTFNSLLTCNLKSYSEKNCVRVGGKKECRKVTDVR